MSPANLIEKVARLVVAQALFRQRCFYLARFLDL